MQVLTTTQEPNMVNLRVRFRSNSDNFRLSTVNCAMISPQVIIVPEIISIKYFSFFKGFFIKKIRENDVNRKREIEQRVV